MRWTGIAAVVALVAAPAFAEEVFVEGHRQTTVMLKGGVGDYTGGSASLNAGPVWGVGLGVQPWDLLGFELAYNGSLNPMSSVGSVVRNGGSALIKISPPFFYRVRPFLGAGVGASVVSSVNNAATPYNGSLMGEVPLAAGIEFNTRYVSAGVRATYWVLAGNNLARQTNFFDGAATIGAWF